MDRRLSAVQVGIVGVGYWGPNLVRTLSDIQDVQLAAVSDLRPGRLDFISKRYPRINTTTNFRDIVSNEAIDAVVIATPPQTHHELALAALRAGKHVLIEKPLATSVEQAEEIVELAERLNRSVVVGHLFLYAAAVVRARNLLNEGALGTLYYVSAVRTNVGPPGAIVDALWDLAPHDISIIHNVMQSEPEDVVAFGCSFTHKHLAETVFLVLRFGDGRIAHIHVGWLTPNKTRLLRMVCSGGELVYNDMEPVQKLQLYAPGADNRVTQGCTSAALGYSSGGIWSPPLENTEPLRMECLDFINSIRTGETPVSNGYSGLAVVRVLEKASRSLASGGRSVWQAMASAELSEVIP